MKQQIELRVQNAELVSESKGKLIVSGYVNKTEQLSEVLGVSKRFREKIAKGAFAYAIKGRKKDIDFLLEHKSDQILASTRNGSLKLEEDNIGLKMTAEIVGTTWGRDSYELIKSGILRNMSFGFRSVKDSWKQMANGIYERTIEALELFEVSVVKTPAYAQSEIQARSIEFIEDPVITNVTYTSPELRINQLQIEIERQKDKVRRAENTVQITIDSEVFKNVLKREKEQLEKFENELRQLEANINEKMEESKMENRELQTTTNVGNSTSTEPVGEIVKKLEDSAKIYARARKIPFTGEELKVPYEVKLDAAEFVAEGANLPEINLNLNGFAVMGKKRVGAAMKLSKKLMIDSGVDLSSHVKDLLIRRTGKALEKAILTGSTVDEFAGIAPDSNVVSEKVAVSPTVDSLRKLNSSSS